MTHPKRKGFTLAEVCIVMVLTSMIAILIISLMTMSSKGFTATQQMLNVAMQDADFASRINTAIRKSGTSFTIPEQSFIEANLTAGWNYLGVMHDVHIPAEVSRTGKEINSTDALVYIEYAGSTEPLSAARNSQLIHTDDGWFILNVIGHNYTDTYGNIHEYSLIFMPTDPENHAAQTLSYEFSSTVSGKAGESDSNTVDTILRAINAIQVVYQGSSVNPATALAFRSDFLPIWSAESVSTNDAPGTVIMVMDVSSSMTAKVGNTQNTRISVLQSTAKGFLDELSADRNINVLLTTFAAFGDNIGTNFSQARGFTPALNLTNAVTGLDRLKKTVDAIKTSQSTNLGDGLRVTYHKLKSEMQNNPKLRNDPVFLLIMTDGAVNSCTVKTRSGWNVTYGENDFYTGNLTASSIGFRNQYTAYTANYSDTGTRLGRAYYQYYGNLINEEFHPKTFLISMYDGMSADDREALRTVFDDSETFNAGDVAEFEEVFSQISDNISSALWAFEGPRI